MAPQDPSHRPEAVERSAAGAARSTLGLVTAAILLAALGQASVFALRFDCFDFYQFWVVGQAVREPDAGNIWSPQERARLGQDWLARAQREQASGGPGRSQRRVVAAGRRAELETYSTPWLYTLFGWTASGDYDRDLTRFQNVSLAAFALGLLAFARVAGLSWSLAGLLIAFLVSWFAPTLSDVNVGNVNRLQVAALGLYVWVGSRRRLPARDLLAGAVLGAAALFKPNLAYPALALGLGWLVLGRWGKLARQLGGALLGALAAFGLSSAWFGRSSSWSDWTQVLGELMGQYDHALAKGNFALVRLLGDLGLPLAAWLPGPLLGGALLLALVLRRRALAGLEVEASQAAWEDLTLVGLGAALALLTARLAWLHYFLLAVPLVFVTLRPRARPWVRVLGALGLVLLANEPLKDLLHYAGNGTVSASLVCLGVALLYGASLYELARPQPSSSSC